MDNGSFCVLALPSLLLNWNFNFRSGEIVTPDDVSDSPDWDIGVSGLKIRTNSGTTGTGDGGGYDPSATDLASITSAPDSGFSVDEMLTDPADGVTSFSGNAVLGGFWEVAGTSTAPKDAAYLLRAASGGFVRLEVTGYSDGQYDLDWAYAGAGQREF